MSWRIRLVFIGLNLASGRGQRDPALEVAWAPGLTMLVAGVVLYLVRGFTMGLGVTTGLVAVGSGLGLGLFGVICGTTVLGIVFTFWR